MIKFNKRDYEGYLKILEVLEEGKAFGETLQEGTTQVINGLSISKGKTPKSPITWDMESIVRDFPAINKEQYGKAINRKASVSVKVITK